MNTQKETVLCPYANESSAVCYRACSPQSTSQATPAFIILLTSILSARLALFVVTGTATLEASSIWDSATLCILYVGYG